LMILPVRGAISSASKYSTAYSGSPPFKC